MLAQAVNAAATSISEGQSIAVPLKESGVPPIVTHMIAIGRRRELTMLGKVADAYENIVDSIVNTLTSLLTPALTLLMGGVVALIAVAILLPMMEMSSIVR